MKNSEMVIFHRMLNEFGFIFCGITAYLMFQQKQSKLLVHKQEIYRKYLKQAQEHIKNEGLR